MKARDSQTGTLKNVYVKALDSLPVGSEIDYSGQASSIPEGWEQVTDPNSYSNTEVKTNKTWINGKPLYRKVLVINNLPNSATTSYAHSISNIDLIYIEKAFWVLSDGACGPIPQYVSSSEITSMYVNKTNVVITTNVNYSPRKGYVVLEYTKSTD